MQVQDHLLQYICSLLVDCFNQHSSKVVDMFIYWTDMQGVYTQCHNQVSCCDQTKNQKQAMPWLVIFSGIGNIHSEHQGMVQAWVGHFVTPLKCMYDKYD
jgi:hypothetical protein